MEQDPPDPKLKKAAADTINTVRAKQSKDRLDALEERTLHKEAAAADVLEATADGRRTDNRLRSVVTYTLLSILVLLIVFVLAALMLYMLGTIPDGAPLLYLIAPGGLLITIVVALGFLYRRK